MSETAAVTNTQIETPLVQRSQRLTGAAIRSQFSQPRVMIRNNWVAADGMTVIMGQAVIRDCSNRERDYRIGTHNCRNLIQ